MDSEVARPPRSWPDVSTCRPGLIGCNLQVQGNAVIEASLRSLRDTPGRIAPVNSSVCFIPPLLRSSTSSLRSWVATGASVTGAVAATPLIWMSHIELAKPVTNVIEKTIGPGFIGFTITLSLWGISIAQTVFYYWSFPRDARANKLTVAFLTLAECINTVLLSDMYWEMLVVNKSPAHVPKFP